MCAGMSSGPSVVCSKYGAFSGTARENQRSMSPRTSGSAFSLIASDADVCWMNRCASPTSNCRELGHRGDDLARDEMKAARARLQANLGLVPPHVCHVMSNTCAPPTDGRARGCENSLRLLMRRPDQDVQARVTAPKETNMTSGKRLAVAFGIGLLTRSARCRPLTRSTARRGPTTAPPPARRLPQRPHVRRLARRRRHRRAQLRQPSAAARAWSRVTSAAC